MSSQTLAYFINSIRKAKELDVKEKDILIARLNKKTLIRVAKKYHFSDETIRQIEMKALTKIRKSNCQLFLFD